MRLSSRNEGLGAERNVERRTAPDHRAAVRSSRSLAAEFAAPRGIGANRAQLPGAQKSAARNQSPDEIFLGGLVPPAVIRVKSRDPAAKANFTGIPRLRSG